MIVILQSGYRWIGCVRPFHLIDCHVFLRHHHHQAISSSSLFPISLQIGEPLVDLFLSLIPSHQTPLIRYGTTHWFVNLFLLHSRRRLLLRLLLLLPYLICFPMVHILNYSNDKSQIDLLISFAASGRFAWFMIRDDRFLFFFASFPFDSIVFFSFLHCIQWRVDPIGEWQYRWISKTDSEYCQLYSFYLGIGISCRLLPYRIVV